MNQVYSHLLFPELSEAISNGYCEHFILCADGFLQCFSNPDKRYEILEMRIQAITCSILKATLYLIDTNDGFYKGTMVEYWECSG